ncbi:helix-turn-helix domain-containing protein [Anaerophaga thermohalophila]|jgi:predicted site-specific integrase-resolvase|uniref:helix-turn-helix domain-containing protein n=1 Tax=Anaerophaga thermohalophila TaxID=177400 RepID=UPI000237C831|nr:helix-turn-helix domain-containing protein [Anaerophaga thermohalophila]
MTAIEPQVNDSGRYSVKETSEVLKINRRTLHRHTIAGYIKPGYRRTNGRAFYTGAEIKRYWKSQY